MYASLIRISAIQIGPGKRGGYYLDEPLPPHNGSTPEGYFSGAINGGYGIAVETPVICNQNTCKQRKFYDPETSVPSS